jgi:integrase/recombinase XerD
VSQAVVERGKDAVVLSRPSEEYLTWLAVERGRSRNTLAAYRRDLVAYESYLARRQLALDHGDPGILEAFLSERRSQGLAAASVARGLTAVRGLHRFCIDEGGHGRDPTADVRPPRTPRRLPKAIDEDEVSRLLDAARPVDPAGRRDRAMLELLYGTGMRVSELVGLSLSDLSSDTGLISVVGKGDKERLVPVGRFASAALDAWLGAGGRPELEPRRWARRGDAEAVFLNARGGRLTRQGAWMILKGRARQAGLEDRVHPHVLRHSCATHMLARGADIRVVQELLGHRSVATTQIYTRVTPEHLRRAYEQAHPRAGPQAGK